MPLTRCRKALGYQIVGEKSIGAYSTAEVLVEEGWIVIHLVLQSQLLVGGRIYTRA
jgi:hypothetical protein